jgi:diguanylate cyclase (GGDEF)-like protein
MRFLKEDLGTGTIVGSTEVDISDVVLEIQRLKDRYEMATSTAKLGVWEYDIATCEAIWDQNTKRLFGADELIDKVPDEYWENRLHPEDRYRAISICETAIRERQSFEQDYRIILLSGELKHVRVRAGYKHDVVLGSRMIGVVWDITHDVKQAEELRISKELAESNTMKIELAQLHLEFSALHDALTQLPNRRHLDNTLDRLSRQHPHLRNSQLAALHIDLDRFKQINDTLGHAAGDAILRSAAQTLKSEIGDKAFISRIGGDEFIVIIENAPDSIGLSALASSIIKRLREPIFFEGNECRSGASIGIATCPMGAVSGRTMLINSDIALYRAKSEGRNRFCFFTDDMQQKVTADKKCADDIRRGLERNEFFTVYQPQFDARNNSIIGVEALVRWRHPDRGVLMPDSFLGVAAEMNVVAAIDELVLEMALADLANWRLAGLNIPNISVNVSARRLGDKNLIDSLKKLDIPANSLSFELLESIYLDNQDEIVSSNLAEIKRLGIGLEIDDFGTGHASIACLLSLRPKRLKIDRQLVQPILVSVELRRLLASIVGIGEALGIEVLAEGVETQEHAQILAGLDCYFFQGFAFARPMEADAMDEFLRKQEWRKVA